MMRWTGIFGLLLLLSGCAAQPVHPQTMSSQLSNPTDGMAMALVLDPPATMGLPPIELFRSARSASAFGSYRSLMATYFSIHTYDRQTSDWNDRYERRTEMNRAGVSYR